MNKNHMDNIGLLVIHSIVYLWSWGLFAFVSFSLVNMLHKLNSNGKPIFELNLCSSNWFLHEAQYGFSLDKQTKVY
jgi:hypothetical protein